jgi:Holliday junction DNA helicase RuvA
LKEKVIKNKTGENIQPIQHNNIENDALNALVSLGIARNAAYTALQKTLKQSTGLSLEEIIKLKIENQNLRRLHQN